MNSNSERSGFEGYPPYPVVYVRNYQENAYHREMYEMPEDDPLQNKYYDSSFDTSLTQMNTYQENADQNLIGTRQNFADQANTQYQQMHEMSDYASIQPQNTYCNLTNITYPMMQSSNGPPDNENLNCIGRTENIGHSEFHDVGESTVANCSYQNSGSNLQKSRSIFKYRRVSRSTKFLKPYTFEAGESAKTIQALPLRDKYGMSDCTGNEEHPPYPEYVPPQNKYYDTSLDQYFPPTNAQLKIPRKPKTFFYSKFHEPYKFEIGESAETIQALPLRDKNGMIDTVNVHKRVKYELYVKRCTKRNFLMKVFDIFDGDGHYFADTVKDLKPYNTMKAGKKVYEKACEWLMLCDDDKKAVLEGKETRCCLFDVIRKTSNSVRTKYAEWPIDQNLTSTSQSFADETNAEYTPIQSQSTYFNPSIDDYFPITQSVDIQPHNEDQSSRNANLNCGFSQFDVSESGETAGKISASENSIKKANYSRFYRPYKFEAGESAETICTLPLHDKNGMIDTVNVMKQLRYELYLNACTKTHFFNSLFRKKPSVREIGYFSELVKDPRPYNQMESRKLWLRKTCEWLELCYNDKKAVLDGEETKCCPFEVMESSFQDPGVYNNKFSKPYQFETGESAETLQILPLHDKNGMIDTVNVMKRLKYELFIKKCTTAHFFESLFGKNNSDMDKKYFTQLVKNPRPYNQMASRQFWLEKTCEWLILCDDDKKAVLEGKETKTMGLIQNPVVPRRFSKPYQFEAGESAETIQTLLLHDENGMVDTRNVIKQFRYELYLKQCSNAKFLHTVIGNDDSIRRAFHRLITTPKVYEKMMRTERFLFEKAYKWLKLCDDDKRAVLDGKETKCCSFKVMESSPLKKRQ